MYTVNYFYIKEIFTLLEVIEVCDGVEFESFDPNLASDVQDLANSYILPTVASSSQENRRKLQATLAYYTNEHHASFQDMRDEHQELSLYDPDSWTLFFTQIGQALFGDDFANILDASSITEKIDEKEGRQIFEFE